MTAVAPLDPVRLARVRDRLSAHDWRSVTVAELAEAAGLSRMTLHRRGINKEQVLAQLGARLQAEYSEAMLAALTGTGSARERLGEALRAICEVDERYLGVLGALTGRLGAVFHDPGEENEPVLTRAAFTDGIRRLLEDGAHDGSIAVADPVETATLLFNAVGHTYEHMRTGHRWPAEVARERIVALLLDGLPA